jgi:hypothetical protein
MSRVRANNFVDKVGTGAPTFPYGVNVTGVATATTFSGNLTGEVNAAAFDTNSSGVVVTGIATATTFSGNLSGNITGAASTAAVLGINTTSLNSTKFYVSGNSASQVVTLTDGATITPDFSTGNNFTVTLGDNRTLANPTNTTVGQSGVIYIVQDGTGSRTLGVGTHWHFPAGTAPTLTTTANAVDVFAFSVRSSTSVVANAILDVKVTA